MGKSIIYGHFMVIFNSYVKLPEGNGDVIGLDVMWNRDLMDPPQST